MKLLCSLAAVCGSSVVALAGSTPGFTLETRWVAVTTAPSQAPRGAQLPNGTVVDTNLNQVTIQNDYRQRFELQARITNVTGQNNLGVFVMAGDINTQSSGMSDAVLLNKSAVAVPGLGRSGEFSFGPGNTEHYLIDGSASAAQRVDTIQHFEAVAAPHVVTPWNYNFDTGQPGAFPSDPGTNAGAGDNWASIYRVMVDITPTDVDQNTGSVTVNFSFNHSSGYSSPTGMRAWALFVQQGQSFPAPDEFNPVTDVVWYAQPMFGTHGEGNYSDIEIPASFTLNVIPAPSAAGLLGLGGLIASRRRRN